MEPAAASPTETNRDRYQFPAVRVEQGPVIDGVLDDQVWGQAALIDEFVQQEPLEGAPATERTEVRVLFDGASLYVSVLAFDSSPQRVTATEMRRDGSQIMNEDSFQIILDTFMDSNSAYMFDAGRAVLGTSRKRTPSPCPHRVRRGRLEALGTRPRLISRSWKAAFSSGTSGSVPDSPDGTAVW